MLRKIHCFQYLNLYLNQEKINLSFHTCDHTHTNLRNCHIASISNNEYSERIMIVEESIGNKIKVFINKLLSRSYLALNLT